MPAIKEVMADAPQANANEEVASIPAKEIKPAEASSGTLPAEASSGTLPAEETEILTESGEGEVAPDLGQGETLEEGKNVSVSIEIKNEDKQDNIPVITKDGKSQSEEIKDNTCSSDLPSTEGNIPDAGSPAVKTDEPNVENDEPKVMNSEESQSEDSTKQEASPMECENEEFKQASPEESKTEEALEVISEMQEVGKFSENKIEAMEVNEGMKEDTGTHREENVIASNVEYSAVSPDEKLKEIHEEMKSSENVTTVNMQTMTDNTNTVNKETMTDSPIAFIEEVKAKGSTEEEIKPDSTAAQEGTKTEKEEIASLNTILKVNKDSEMVDLPCENIDLRGNKEAVNEKSCSSKTEIQIKGSKESDSDILVKSGDIYEIKDSAELKGENNDNLVKTVEKTVTLNIESSTLNQNGKPDSMEIVSEASNSKEIDPESEKLVEDLFKDGKAALLVGDCFTAADILGKCCEEARKIYGELDIKNVEYYFQYGCAMLDCAKNENMVLGEKIKQKDLDEDDLEDEEEKEEEEEESEEIKEEKDNDEMKKNGGSDAEPMVLVENIEDKSNKDKGGEIKNQDLETNETVNGDVENGDEEEDTSLRVAWEMFELSKVIFIRKGDNEKLAETYLKLGEVGVESGHPTAMNDMLQALDLRKKIHSENSRIIAETCFNIGLAFSSFQLFDEAIEYFQKSKSILNFKLDDLSKLDTKEAQDEVKDIKDLIPDLDEKIQDMKESKEEKIKKIELEKLNGEAAAQESCGSSSNKPVSNISHLVKRKRKLEDVTSDLLPSNKQPCTETPETNTSDTVN